MFRRQGSPKEICGQRQVGKAQTTSTSSVASTHFYHRSSAFSFQTTLTTDRTSCRGVDNDGTYRSAHIAEPYGVQDVVRRRRNPCDSRAHQSGKSGGRSGKIHYLLSIGIAGISVKSNDLLAKDICWPRIFESEVGGETRFRFACTNTLTGFSQGPIPLPIVCKTRKQVW